MDYVYTTPAQSSAKYYLKNKVERGIIMKKYYDDNAERIKARRRERYRLSKIVAVV
jgi:hypothetical protein